MQVSEKVMLFLLIAFIYCWSICWADSTNVNIPFDHHFHNGPLLPLNTWGTIRGLHYFGLRSSSPDSPAIGLVWFTNDAKDVKGLKLRHFCDPNDNLRYGWKSHNFRDFGFQQIDDKNFTLNTSFIKYSADDWKALISVDSTQVKDKIISLIIYAITPRTEDSLKTVFSNKSSLHINGFNQFMGNFSIKIGSVNEKNIFSGQLDTNSSIVDLVENSNKSLV